MYFAGAHTCIASTLGKKMKSPVKQLAPEKILRTHPIKGKVDGWFFRVREVSNSVYEVEGTDLYGRKVSKTGTETESILEECIADAKNIINQTKSKT